MQSENKKEFGDLAPILPLEGDEKEVKLEPEETIAERVKLTPQKINTQINK